MDNSLHFKFLCCQLWVPNTIAHVVIRGEHCNLSTDIVGGDIVDSGPSCQTTTVLQDFRNYQEDGILGYGSISLCELPLITLPGPFYYPGIIQRDLISVPNLVATNPLYVVIDNSVNRVRKDNRKVTHILPYNGLYVIPRNVQSDD